MTISPDADIASKLVALASLHDAGSLSDSEFADAKDQLLHGHRPPIVGAPPAPAHGWPFLKALLVTVAAVGIVAAAAYGAARLAGPLAGIVVALLLDVVVLSFLTLRAYPPRAKIPWVRLGIGVFVMTPIPIIYLAWLWMTGKKWRERAR